MSDFTLTKTRISEGTWEGLLTANASAGVQPSIEVTHLDKPIEGVTVAKTDDAGKWSLQIKIPTSVIADGVQTLLINDTTSGETLDAVTLIAGEALADDIRAEVDLLRAELDMLKRAFRRHCLQTM